MPPTVIVPSNWPSALSQACGSVLTKGALPALRLSSANKAANEGPERTEAVTSKHAPANGTLLPSTLRIVSVPLDGAGDGFGLALGEGLADGRGLALGLGEGLGLADGLGLGDGLGEGLGLALGEGLGLGLGDEAA